MKNEAPRVLIRGQLALAEHRNGRWDLGDEPAECALEFVTRDAELVKPHGESPPVDKHKEDHGEWV